MEYLVKSGVRLNDYLSSAIQALQDKLDFQIIVTSGLRDARAQARAMLNNKQKYDQMAQDGVVRDKNPKIPYNVNYLVDLYADDAFAWSVEETYPQSPLQWTEENLDEAEKAVEVYYARGGGMHNKGLAFDLSYAYNLTSPRVWITGEDLQNIEKAGAELEYNVEREFDHYHIEIPKPSLTTEKKNLALLFLGGALLWTFRKS